ncbi:hypothetical protein [Polaromonas sp.]|uniref:hypothetical protein n=1 Tax=Polaromonas sp. TaxID=1869339 RepID=UPI002489B04A|nr:hypothetical protein [Polaromonas sp.]MDI1340153.1 hypothetical protein [Polaromonas sp.]
MSTRLISILAATTVLGLAGCAPMPPGHAAHHPGVSAPAPGQGMPMARMDDHMTAMRAMHDRMSRAKTPEERNALMAEHQKLMQDGMGMMGGMGPGATGGMGGMGGMTGPGTGPMAGDPAARQQWMEKRMEMMQSMMQMMMDRLPPAPAKP